MKAAAKSAVFGECVWPYKEAFNSSSHADKPLSPGLKQNSPIEYSKRPLLCMLRRLLIAEDRFLGSSSVLPGCSAHWNTPPSLGGSVKLRERSPTYVDSPSGHYARPRKPDVSQKTMQQSCRKVLCITASQILRCSSHWPVSKPLDT